MNVSSSDSSTYTNAAYSNKGMSGLISQMDTESLVQSMLSGIQAKIDKQNQAKQQLLWKQEIYRDIISDINNFQAKYFNLASDSCLRLESFYNWIWPGNSFFKRQICRIFRSICPASENSNRSKNNLYGRSRIYTYNYGKGISFF